MIDSPIRLARAAQTLAHSVVDFAAVVVVVGCFAGCFAGCFTLVSSGIRREVPEGARAAAKGLTRPHERVVAAWDGSILQDGSLLVVLGDVGLARRDGEAVARVELVDINSIVVNEDDGCVDIITAGGVGLSLPLRSSDERKAFAKLIQTEVQRAKRDSARSHEAVEPPAPVAPAPVAAVAPVDDAAAKAVEAAPEAVAAPTP